MKDKNDPNLPVAFGCLQASTFHHGMFGCIWIKNGFVD
jgi:hypothetical protein